ncbi:glycosyltransferase [uncultured Microbulbifer sp.]|uniref:glycosyltransferase n=1 Tax=uncultured Microbulbifer sp. TaxID=348147 RepID=UPI00262260B2|nr:glycosyltransferase [uncultured Microbulbifer sp.]
MRICQLLASNSSGGLAKHFIELSNALSQIHDIVVICPAKFKTEFNSNIIHIEFEPRGSSNNPLNLYKFLQAIKKAQPEIIHAHGNSAVNFAAKAKLFSKIKTIGTIHWNLKRKKNRKGYEKLDSVIGISSGVLRDIKNPNQRIIHLGITPTGDPTDHRNQLLSDYGLSRDKPICLAIGRLVKGKGFDLLIRAWQGVDANLLIVGDGPLRKDLDNLLKELNVTNTHLCGPIHNASRLIPSVDMVAISSHSEGFSYVLAEALIDRKPVIATEVFGPLDVLPKFALVPIGNEKIMHEKLSQATANLEQWNQDFSDTYAWATKHLSMESMIRQTVEAYQDLLEPQP